MSPEWRLNLGFGTQKMRSFPLKRDVPSIAVTHSKIMRKVFPGPNFVSPEWRCPMNRGFLKERFHCNHVQQSARHTYRQQQVAPVVSYAAFLLLVLFCFVFFFFFTKRLDVILTCKNKNKNMSEELLMGLSSSKPL